MACFEPNIQPLCSAAIGAGQASEKLRPAPIGRVMFSGHQSAWDRIGNDFAAKSGSVEIEAPQKAKKKSAAQFGLFAV